MPAVGDALQLVLAGVLEHETRSRDQVLHRGRHEYLARSRERGDLRAARFTAIPPTSSPTVSISPVCTPARTSSPSSRDRLRDRLRAADRPAGPSKVARTPSPVRLHLSAPRSARSLRRERSGRAATRHLAPPARSPDRRRAAPSNPTISVNSTARSRVSAGRGACRFPVTNQLGSASSEVVLTTSPIHRAGSRRREKLDERAILRSSRRAACRLFSWLQRVTARWNTSVGPWIAGRRGRRSPGLSISLLMRSAHVRGHEVTAHRRIPAERISRSPAAMERSGAPRPWPTPALKCSGGTCEGLRQILLRVIPGWNASSDPQLGESPNRTSAASRSGCVAAASTDERRTACRRQFGAERSPSTPNHGIEDS